MKKKEIDKVGQKQVFIISLDPYEQDCIVVVNGTVKDALKLLKKQDSLNAIDTVKEIEDNFKDYSEAHTRGGAILFHKLPAGYIMMFNHEDSWISTVEHVVHESLHLVRYVLERAGLELTDESEEAFTYLQGHTVGKILRNIY